MKIHVLVGCICFMVTAVSAAQVGTSTPTPIPTLTPQAPTMPAPPSAIIQPTNTDGLRSRSTFLSYRYLRTNAVMEATASGVSSGETQVINTETAVVYGKNFGQFQAGIGYAVDSEMISDKDNKTEQTIATVISLEARLNLISNTPGHDFIPYGGLKLRTSTLEISASGTNSANLNGSGLSFGAGFDWFPFSELFALNVELGQAQINLSGSNLDLSGKGNSLIFGFQLYY